MNSIAIIGFGRIGKLISRYLRNDFQINVYDPFVQDEEIINFGQNPIKLEELNKYKFIILCVPIRKFEKTVISIKNYLCPGAIIADVCSVKEHPMKIFKKHLSKNVFILGTHPMFGPDSGKYSVEGKKLILTPFRIPKFILNNIIDYLKKFHLELIVTSAEDHDKQMANTLLLTHIIGRTLIEFGSKDQLIDTAGYIQLMKILKTVQNDSWELYEDMHHFNKYSAQVRENLRVSLNKMTKGFDHA